jgi:hypothetical protein
MSHSGSRSASNGNRAGGSKRDRSGERLERLGRSARLGKLAGFGGYGRLALVGGCMGGASGGASGGARIAAGML